VFDACVIGTTLITHYFSLSLKVMVRHISTKSDAALHTLLHARTYVADELIAVALTDCHACCSTQVLRAESCSTARSAAAGASACLQLAELRLSSCYFNSSHTSDSLCAGAAGHVLTAASVGLPHSAGKAVIPTTVSCSTALLHQL
jgi:hypothetical protein